VFVIFRNTIFFVFCLGFLEIKNTFIVNVFFFFFYLFSSFSFSLSKSGFFFVLSFLLTKLVW
jgi:hypothetical protein